MKEVRILLKIGRFGVNMYLQTKRQTDGQTDKCSYEFIHKYKPLDNSLVQVFFFFDWCFSLFCFLQKLLQMTYR